MTDPTIPEQPDPTTQTDFDPAVAMGWIDDAVGKGLLKVTDDGRIDVVNAEETWKQLDQKRTDRKLARPVDAEDDTRAQEEIILGAALAGTEDNASLWAKFRGAIGLRPGQPMPEWLWSNDDHIQLAVEIDSAFRGKRDVRRINGAALVECFRLRAEENLISGSLQTFSQLVRALQASHAFYCSNDVLMAIEILQSKRARSALREIGRKLDFALRADRPVEEAVDVASEALEQARDLVRGRLGVDHGFDDMEGLHATLRERMEGHRASVIPTGIPALDMNMQGGIRPDDTGKLFVIGARTGVGKTTVAVGAAMGLTLHGASVLFLSCELNGGEIGARAMARYARSIGQAACKTWILEGRGRDRAAPLGYDEVIQTWRAQREAGEIGGWKSKALFLSTADDMIEFIYAAKAKDPSLSAVFIDHFHAMRPTKGGSSNRPQEMEERVLLLHQGAKAAGVDLFLLAQLNRQACLVERPELEHINGTDAIAQLASAVWLLEFPKKPKEGPPPSHDLNCWHGKHRNGQRLWDRKPPGPIEVSELQVVRDYCAVNDLSTLSQFPRMASPMDPTPGYYIP